AQASDQTSAPVVSTPTAPAPETSYSMPWDEPVSGGVSVGASNYNQVPRSDEDVAAVLDDSVKNAVPTPQPATASVPETEQASTPKSDPTPASPEDVAARSALPPELNSVADMLEKVFGPAVSLSVEKKPDTETPADPANK
ncbi:MAG: DNA polymerase III subunit gamma/tau, partial [Lancefieldella parvula]